jgi:hypothetical protein
LLWLITELTFTTRQAVLIFNYAGRPEDWRENHPISG